MSKRISSILSILSLALCAAVLLGGYVLTAEQRSLSSKLVRLHVVANSDSEADQAVKLEVRDAVLARTRTLLEGRSDPVAALRAGLPQIEAAANETLLRAGSGERASVSLGRELFPTREYETFSLPAGRYTALRVTIGAGAGHNWWCVVYPSICLSASTAEFERAAQAAGLTGGEIRLITGDSEGYVLKFKAMELLETVRAWLAGTPQ